MAFPILAYLLWPLGLFDTNKSTEANIFFLCKSVLDHQYTNFPGLLKQNAQAGWLVNKRKLLSHSPGGSKSEIKVSAGLVSPEVSLLGSHLATYLICPHSLFLCIHIPGISFSSYKYSNAVGFEPTLMTEC